MKTTLLALSMSTVVLASIVACGGADPVPVGADGSESSSGSSGSSGTSGTSGTSASGGTSGSSGTSGTSGSDASTCPTYFQDSDGDGFGGATTKVSCTPPGAGWVTVGGDCDDTNKDVKPGQTAYFHAGYATVPGGAAVSFDYDCSKKEDLDPAQKKATDCAQIPGSLECSGSGYLPQSPPRAGAGVDPYCGSTRYRFCRPTPNGACAPSDNVPTPAPPPFPCR